MVLWLLLLCEIFTSLFTNIFFLSVLVVKNAEIYEEEGEIIVVVDDVNPSSQYTSNSYIPSILSTKDRFKLSDKMG